ncbi:MAG: protein translocase SEC61 complex subunit gamma [Candidatus Diapherotrites archaeon CG08_land_8_20_14_0_20_30_16]|nr:MAG: protein translocase SEC61 complex subunit gamma [Candidatus Diapherotrites archaeon CG08_land_8_20_14_0_20_30_16]
MTFWENTKRVFLVAKKPTGKEYWNLAKVVGLGIILIGVLGFLIMLIMTAFYSPL